MPENITCKTFAIGLILGLLCGYMIGFCSSSSSSFKSSRRGKGFASRLYGEKFDYPPYLDPDKIYNLKSPSGYPSTTTIQL